MDSLSIASRKLRLLSSRRMLFLSFVKRNNSNNLSKMNALLKEDSFAPKFPLNPSLIFITATFSRTSVFNWSPVQIIMIRNRIMPKLNWNAGGNQRLRFSLIFAEISLVNKKRELNHMRKIHFCLLCLLWNLSLSTNKLRINISNCFWLKSYQKNYHKSTVFFFTLSSRKLLTFQNNNLQ